jgi:hypothetical protein
MPKPLYTWEPKTRRFRKNDGTFISPAKMTALRTEFLKIEQDRNADLAKRLFAKEITISQFEAEFKDGLNRVYAVQYMAAKGGRKQMTPSDWGALGAQLKKQYKYVDGFALKLAAGGYRESEVDKVIDRMNRYLPPSQQAFERGEIQVTYPGIKLPRYPGDGNTICSYGCHCHLEIEDLTDRWLVRWVINPAVENCTDCQELARTWNPLVIMK